MKNIKKIFALLVLVSVSACGGLPFMPSAPTPTPTAPPAPPATRTALPPPPTAAPTLAPPVALKVTVVPKDAWQPPSGDGCSDLANAMSKKLSVGVTTAQAPFKDYVTGKTGVGCQALAKGTGVNFKNFSTVANTLKEMLRAQGWSEDIKYAADGPTGTAIGLRKGNALALLAVNWKPVNDTLCPKDKPISTCTLKPEQQLYTITLDVAQDTSAPATAATFTDPFAYCAAVGDIDKADARYVGQPVPEVIGKALKKASGAAPDAPLDMFLKSASWRCMGGKVYGCFVGANIPCSTKANTSRTPTAEMKDFCKTQPNAENIPAVATGRETIFQWRCKNGAPEIVKEIFKVDARGYIADFWYQLSPN